MSSKPKHLRLSLLRSLALPLSLIFSGCVYDAPLTEENTIPVDEVIPGHWGKGAIDQLT